VGVGVTIRISGNTVRSEESGEGGRLIRAWVEEEGHEGQFVTGSGDINTLNLVTDLTWDLRLNSTRCQTIAVTRHLSTTTVYSFFMSFPGHVPKLQLTLAHGDWLGRPCFFRLGNDRPHWTSFHSIIINLTGAGTCSFGDP